MLFLRAWQQRSVNEFILNQMVQVQEITGLQYHGFVCWVHKQPEGAAVNPTSIPRASEI